MLTEAMPMFEKAVEMSPGDETYAGNLGDAYRWAGQKYKANASYQKAIALAYKQLQVNPRDAATMGHLAGRLAQQQALVGRGGKDTPPPPLHHQRPVVGGRVKAENR